MSWQRTAWHWIAALTWFSSPVLADNEPFQVDLMVFEQQADDQDTKVSHEVWPHYVPTPYPENAIHLVDRGETFFNPLDNTHKLLGFHEGRLRKSSHYHVLWHKSWVQPPSSRSSKPVIIENTDETPRDITLHGTVQVTQKRFQTVYLNIILTNADGHTSYRLSETRHIREEDLQYFDHPKLGALLMIKPYTPEILPEQTEDH